MAVDINAIKYIPDLPGAQTLTGADALHLNQQSVDVQVSLNTLAAFIADSLHPIGSLLFFGDKNRDPNTLFPGQTWVRVQAGRDIRVCKDDESDLGTLIGSDKLTLTASMLPRHDHDLDANGATGKAVLGGKHGHAAQAAQAGGHNHGNNQTSENGDHTHPASMTPTGGHDHEYPGEDFFARSGAIPTGRQAGMWDVGSTQDYRAMYYKTTKVGDHVHSFSITINGKHRHTFILNTDGQHTHTITVTENGEHEHRLSGKTGTVGNGTEIDITNRKLIVAVWKRTA